jgi:DNA helicase-2/ATP-dependent DNA helicase PcrA
LSDPIVTEEQGNLERVRRMLEERPPELPAREAGIVAELVRLREEVHSAKEEDKPALLQQYDYHWSLLSQLRGGRGEASEVDPASPYFGHLRVIEEDRPRDVFIGKATRIEQGIRIVDWRNAPISRIFYRYQQGEEYEEELGGRPVGGQVELRRTLSIQAGELQRVEAPEGVFIQEEGAWQREERARPRLLGGQGSAARAHAPGEGQERRLGTDLAGGRRRVAKYLPDIAGLLDADQFALITRPSSGFVVIRGAAGSGKTTVALHRIAWLAYDDPSVDSERTLFVVFSPALREYVAHVLPALGVHRVQIRDFHGWAHQVRRRHFPRLPATVRESTPANVTRLKLHPAMMLALERQVARVTAPPTAESAVDDWISAITALPQLEAALRELDPDAFTPAELTQAVTWCRDRAEELAAWLEDPAEEPATALDEEDEALLLRAHQLRAGPLKSRKGGPLTFRHIAVDEVQDFTPLEIRVLIGCLDQHRSITLAGDTQQHVMKDAGFTSWTAFFGHLGLDGVAVDTLRVAYRSSRQIVAFSLALLGGLREDDEAPLVTREGPPVELFEFTDTGAAVAFLVDVLKQLQRDEPLANIAILCPNADVSATWAKGLLGGEVPRVRRIERYEFSFAPGIEICEIEQVKGLEFDYVILADVSAAQWRDSSAARRTLHVGATRAIHQLWLVSIGAPSPIMAEALR